MKYPLDCEENFEKSFLFWLAKYVKFKLNSLSDFPITPKLKVFF